MELQAVAVTDQESGATADSAEPETGGVPAVVTVLEPEHLPGLAFFARMAQADLLVALDTWPFRQDRVQNRNRVLGPDGRPTWLTVPIHLLEQGRIADVAIADDGPGARWRERYLRTLEQCYRGHPYFQPLFGEIENVLLLPWDRLADLNVALLEVLARRLQVRARIVRASALGAEGGRAEQVAGLCARLGAGVYLTAPSERDSLDLASFEAAGVAVRVYDYDPPSYPQRGAAAFVSHLSTVDLLFNTGEDAARVLRSSSRLSAFAREKTPAVA